MPYITQERREALRVSPYTRPLDAGELNYVITDLCLSYALLEDSLNYQRLNTVVGVLESAKLEFYRRMVAPYEDKKCKENGDVYPS